ncbi:MAG: 50S ribosomal protein L35 [Candidatus Omnitrophota bacterium]
MPKLKTHKGLAKRLRITKRGKVKRLRAYRGHLLTHKSSKRKRHLRKRALISGADLNAVKKMLPYGR